MGNNKGRRNDKAKRYRAARRDGNSEKLVREIEKAYDLPKGSLQLNNPDGRKTRSDAKVAAVLKNYAKKGTKG